MRRRRSGFAMIDDMSRLKEAMEQMDAEDPTVAQAAKDRAAQTLSDAKLNFAKMAELIEQRRLLLRPRIVAGIKRMDQPGMLGDAAFRDTGSALRREGQSFRQIAEAIERTDRPAPQYEDPVQRSEPPYQMPNEPGRPAWLRALALVASIVFFPLLHPIRFLAIALLGLFLFYALRGCVPSGQQALGYFDGVAAVRDSAGKAMSSVSSSVSSFVNEYILRKPRGRRRRRRPPPQTRRLRPRRRRPQSRRLLLPPHRPPPQPRPLLPRMRRLLLPPRPLLPPTHRLLPHRPRRLPQLHRLPLQVHRFQRRVATRGVNPLQSREPTVARRGRIAIPGLVAAHPSKTIARASKTIVRASTIARALSRTLYRKGSAAIPARQGGVSVASAAAPGAVVDTELLPRRLRFLPGERGDECLEPRCSTSFWVFWVSLSGLSFSYWISGTPSASSEGSHEQ